MQCSSRPNQECILHMTRRKVHTNNDRKNLHFDREKLHTSKEFSQKQGYRHTSVTSKTANATVWCKYDLTSGPFSSAFKASLENENTVRGTFLTASIKREPPPSARRLGPKYLKHHALSIKRQLNVLWSMVRFAMYVQTDTGLRQKGKGKIKIKKIKSNLERSMLWL